MTEIFSDDKEKNKMIEKAMIELEDCPCCRGAGMIVHEGGWNVQVECTVCGAHTVYLEYESEPEKEHPYGCSAINFNLSGGLYEKMLSPSNFPCIIFRFFLRLYGGRFRPVNWKRMGDIPWIFF